MGGDDGVPIFGEGVKPNGSDTGTLGPNEAPAFDIANGSVTPAGPNGLADGMAAGFGPRLAKGSGLCDRGFGNGSGLLPEPNAIAVADGPAAGANGSGRAGAGDKCANGSLARAPDDVAGIANGSVLTRGIVAGASLANGSAAVPVTLLGMAAG
jgi:hypothetical protein